MRESESPPIGCGSLVIIEPFILLVCYNFWHLLSPNSHLISNINCSTISFAFDNFISVQLETHFSDKQYIHTVVALQYNIFHVCTKNNICVNLMYFDNISYFFIFILPVNDMYYIINFKYASASILDEFQIGLMG